MEFLRQLRPVRADRMWPMETGAAKELAEEQNNTRKGAKSQRAQREQSSCSLRVFAPWRLCVRLFIFSQLPSRGGIGPPPPRPSPGRGERNHRQSQRRKSIFLEKMESEPCATLHRAMRDLVSRRVASLPGVGDVTHDHQNVAARHDRVVAGIEFHVSVGLANRQGQKFVTPVQVHFL